MYIFSSFCICPLSYSFYRGHLTSTTLIESVGETEAPGENKREALFCTLYLALKAEERRNKVLRSLGNQSKGLSSSLPKFDTIHLH